MTEAKVREWLLILYLFRDKRIVSAFFCTPIISDGRDVYDEAFVINLEKWVVKQQKNPHNGGFFLIGYRDTLIFADFFSFSISFCTSFCFS
ncbi:hypothetical protein CS953_15760 [Bacillus safensis]|nr:hypothetical protein CS953_15760 [Bacillus safensis]